jgi:hypothetical protein
MSTDVIMPRMNKSIFEDTLTNWLKQTGDPVEKDRRLIKVSIGKALKSRVPPLYSPKSSPLRVPPSQSNAHQSPVRRVSLLSSKSAAR